MFFYGYFDPEKFFLGNKNNYFWCDVTDISSKKEPLTGTSEHLTQYSLAHPEYCTCFI